MTSEIRTNSLTSRAGLSTVTLTDSGPMFSGITTFVDNSTFSVGTGGTIHAPATNTLNIGVNNTESLRIDSNSNLKVAGIVTATHFHGDGSNLTGLTVPGGATNLDLLDSSGTGNGRIRLGASQDLQIYHDGSHSWLKNTTGRLILQTDGDQIQIRGNTIVAMNGAGNSAYVRIDSSGRIGVGVVPTAQFAHNLIQIGHQATLGANAALSATGQTFLTHNLYFDTGGTFRVFNTSNANEGAIFRLVDGQLLFSNSAATTGTPTVTERFRINSNGRVNIGDTNNTNNDLDYCRLSIYGQTSQNGTNKNLNLLNVYNYGSGNSGDITGIGLGAAASPDYTKASLAFIRTTSYGRGDLIFCINSEGNANMVTESDERLRIASDGDTTISASATANFMPGAALNVISDKNVNSGLDDKVNYHLALANPNNDTNEAIGIAFGITDTGAKVGAAIVHQRDAAGSQGHMKFYTRPNNAGPPVERVRIRANGDFHVDSSNASITAQPAFYVHRSSGCGSYRPHSGFPIHHFYSNAGGTFSLESYVNGDGSYTNLSDYRLKENIVSISNGIDIVKQLNPVKFDWKSSSKTKNDLGFIAHEVQTLIPTAVDGTKDQMKEDGSPFYQGIAQTKIIPYLTAALKEAITKIETLEQDNIALRARVTNLEGN